MTHGRNTVRFESVNGYPRRQHDKLTLTFTVCESDLASSARETVDMLVVGKRRGIASD